MPWAKLDDRYDDNRKIKRALRKDPAAVALHAMSITYCSRHETDGHVDPEWLEERMPRRAQREKALRVLVELGLFERNGDGFYVHDYLDHNPSREERAEKREADRERKRQAGRQGGLAKARKAKGAR